MRRIVADRQDFLKVVALVAGALCGAPPALAQDEAAPEAPAGADRYLSGGFFLMLPDSARDVDYGTGMTVGYGARFGENKRWWEARFISNVIETGVKGATDYYQIGLGLDVIQAFGDESAGHPIVFGGLGGHMNDVVPDDEDGTDAFASVGAGWRFRPWASWGLRPRADLRYVYDTFDSGKSDILLAFILEIPPTRERVVEQVVEKEVERVVEKEVVREVEVPPPDADGDGIPDVFDKCPDTIAGAKVEGDGCVRKEQVVTLPNIEFEFAKAVLTPVGRETLQPVVRFLRDQPEVTLDIWGHTDWKGPQTANQPLSENRARAVLEFLVENGIAADRLTSEGFGELKPIATNETEEGRARNRRVELRIRTRGGSE